MGSAIGDLMYLVVDHVLLQGEYIAITWLARPGNLRLGDLTI